MNIDTMTIGQYKELRELFGKANSSKSIEDGGIRIVVLQRGWVAIGKFSQQEEECKLSPAATIRVWGTTKGLGELVEGPTSTTKLDLCPSILFNEASCILMMPANESVWKSKI